MNVGIIRTVDDLGRVCIPKEIRRMAKLLEGDPIEILPQTDGTIVLRKYAPDIPNVEQELARMQQYIKESNYLIPDQVRWVRALEKIRREIYFANQEKNKTE